jgi:hypothetical protein
MDRRVISWMERLIRRIFQQLTSDYPPDLSKAAALLAARLRHAGSQSRAKSDVRLSAHSRHAMPLKGIPEAALGA